MLLGLNLVRLNHYYMNMLCCKPVVLSPGCQDPNHYSCHARPTYGTVILACCWDINHIFFVFICMYLHETNTAIMYPTHVLFHNSGLLPTYSFISDLRLHWPVCSPMFSKTSEAFKTKKKKKTAFNYTTVGCLEILYS